MVREYCTKLIKPVRQCSTACKSKCLASNFDNRSSAANIYNLCNAIDSSLRMTGQKNAIQRFYDGITIQLDKTKHGRKGHEFIWTDSALQHFCSLTGKEKNTVFEESEIDQRIADGAYSIVKEGSDTYLIIEGVEGTLEESSQFMYTSGEPKRMNAVFLIVETSDDKYKVIHFDAPKSKFITPPPAALPQ